MKRLSIIIPLLASIAAPAFAQQPEAVPDTVADIKSPAKVIITDDGTTTEVTVTGTRQRPDYSFVYSVSTDTAKNQMPAFSMPILGDLSAGATGRKSYGEFVFVNNFYIGALIPYTGPSEIRTSLDCGIAELIAYRYNITRTGSSFGIGFGFGGKEFRLRRGTEVGKDGDRCILYPAPEGAENVRASIECYTLQIPVFYRQRIYRDFVFKLSATLNMNVSTKAETKYKYKVKGLHQRMITPDFTFTIGSTEWFGVYVKWSPVKIFKQAYGPQTASWAIGATLGI